MGLAIPDTSQSALDELDDIAVDELEPVDFGQKLTDVKGFDLDSLDDEPIGSTSPLAGFVSIGAGIVKGASKFYRTLGNWESLIYDKLGVEPGEFGHKLGEAIFGKETGIEFKPQVPTGIKFADDLDEWYDYVSSKGIKATDSVSKVAKAVYEGVGIAAVDLPIMSKMGLPAFSALTAGGEAIGAGVDDSEIAKSSAIGLAHGMLLHGVLQSAGFLPRGVRLPLVGSIFGGESLRGEMDKLPEERDYPQVVADFLIGAGLTFPGKGLSIAELKRTPRVIEAARKLRVEVEEKRILEAMDVAERVKAIRGDELGISRYGEQGRIMVDRENTIRPFEKLSEAERKAVRDADVEQLPPTIGVEGRQDILQSMFSKMTKEEFEEGFHIRGRAGEMPEEGLASSAMVAFEGGFPQTISAAPGGEVLIFDSRGIKRAIPQSEITTKGLKPIIRIPGEELQTRFGEVKQTPFEFLKKKFLKDPKIKPDIKIKFLDEEVVEGNKPVEMYEMDIGGVKSDFFVSRAKGENVREKMTERLELYTDPIQPGEVRNPAAEALANKNFGLQKKLNEQYHEWVRGEVKEKVRKEFEGSVVVDGDGNPIKVRQIDKTTFTEDLGNNPVDKFVFLKTENPAVSVDENGIRTWTINEGDKTVDAFESFIKHREKVIKNQPPPPNVSGRDMTFQQLLEILPRRFGGKWPNDKPIVDVFAETTQPEVLSDLVLAKEQALNKILPNIQAYNKFIDNYRTYQKPVSRRIKESNKALDKLRVWVADTGLLFASKLGKAGGSVMQLAIDGHNKEVELYKVAGFHREKLVDIYKKADWNELKRDMVDVSIVKALEDRTNAKRYFTDKDGVLDEDAFEIYKIMQNHFDVMEKHVAASGRGTIENYFTRAVERMSALDQLLNSLESNDFVSVQDALRGKVDSPFLKERKGELEKYRHDVLQVFDIYNSSVIKTLAYEDLVKYYTSTFQKSSEGAFGADVPPELAGTPSFYKMRTEVNKWMRGLVEPEYMYGPVGKFMMKVRRNMYETFLSWNLRAGLDNSTQDMFILAFTPAKTHSIYRDVYKQRRRFDKEAPLLAEALKQAGKDKTYLLELAESDLGRFGETQKKKTGVRYAMSKVSELDPFYMWERANWAKAEVAGLVEYAWKQPGWNDAVVKHKGDHVKAVEDVLSSQPIHQRRSVVSARQLSWQTQFMAGNVASPHIFRTELGKFLGMFKRFSFGQVENMIRSFQQSGTDGIAAVRILARGFPDEVQHVETLRSVETLRKGIEAVEDLARKHPKEVDVDLRAVSMMRKSVVEMEKELNDVIKRLQPINKNNKSTQTRLWARYAAKRWAYAFLFNTMASMVLDFLGFGMSDAFKSQDPLERAVSAASRNLVPFFWEVRNPSRLVASPIIPDTGGAFGGERQYLKGMVEWGFNSVKYAGVVNRLTNRMLSNFVTDQIMPIEKKQSKL